jgi:hypothetical protein
MNLLLIEKSPSTTLSRNIAVAESSTPKRKTTDDEEDSRAAGGPIIPLPDEFQQSMTTFSAVFMP